MATAATPHELGAIGRIRLENVRGFHSVELTPGQTTVVIGRNGTNKTTLLRAIALGLADLQTANALLAQPVGGFIRSGETAAAIELEFESGVVRKTITAGERSEVIEESGATLPVPVFGYGAGRGVVGGDSSWGVYASGGLDDVLSLFDYRKELADPELTLRRLRDDLGSKEYRRTMTGFQRILELSPKDRIELSKGGGIELSGPTVGGGTIPLAGWADGYRLTLSLLIDLFGRAVRSGAIDDEGGIRGIVLIDELDQHLHPALQAGMIDYLQELLPRVQLIATTHSPLLALGAQPSELVVLRRHDDKVVVTPDVPDYRGFSAEDMLADDRLFDSPIYAPQTAAQVSRYDELIGKGPDRRSEEEEGELLELATSMRAEVLPPIVSDKLAEAVADLEQRLS